MILPDTEVFSYYKLSFAYYLILKILKLVSTLALVCKCIHTFQDYLLLSNHTPDSF